MKMPPELEADARRYASCLFGDVDTSTLPFATVKEMISQMALGGWDVYVRDFYRTHRILEGPKESLSPVMAKVMTKDFLYRWAQIRLGPFDTVIADDRLPGMVKIVISHAQVTEYHREDRIKARTTKLYVFTPHDDRDDWWNLSNVFEVDESVEEAHRRFGYINTPERHAQRKWQEEECYRPGTKKSPIDGPIRKLEISHEEAFGKVVPPAESKKNRK